MFLSQILKRQDEYIKRLGVTVPTQPVFAAKKVVEIEKPVFAAKKVVEVSETCVGTSELTLIPSKLEELAEKASVHLEEEIRVADAQVDALILTLNLVKEPSFDLAAFHKRYVMPKSESTKMIGVPAPLTTHAQLSAYLARHKDEPDAPKSLKELVLMCINHTMSTLEEQGA